MLLEFIFLFILGLIFGSFASALTWRYPNGISIKKGRSICPNCRKQIAWFDNIPLFSFILLGGKCRNCGKPISFRYPFIELTTGIGFLILGIIIPLDIFKLIYVLILFVVLFSIFITDLENQIIPDSFVFFGIAVSVIYFTIAGGTAIFDALFVGFTAALILLTIHLVTKGRGMGLGDVKFAVLGGLIVGPKLFLIWLLLAFLTGAAVGIILILGKKAGLKSQIAFGPFLVLAIPLALIYGEKILFWLHIG
jgi:prepilin signal peptidase PulO-like enzyme (type II secretory pathway)